MKQYFPKKNKIFLVIFVLLLSLSLIYSENLKSKETEMSKRLRVDDYYERPVIIQSTHFHHNDHIHVASPSIDFLPQHRPNILPITRNTAQQQSIYSQVESCPCVNEVKCPPCGVFISEPNAICPCAPKPNCPICPPLSLIHEIAAKKVKEIN